MITNMTDADHISMTRGESVITTKEKQLVYEQDISGWPRWMSREDRRILLEDDVEVDTVVAADGSGNHRTVAEAVAAAPINGEKRYVIKIKAGTYRENVNVDKKKINLMFVGEGMKTTIITASKNYVDDGSNFDSATVAINGKGFLARDLTFQNAAGLEKEQAVALRVSADHTAFYKCGILAYQDTLYVHSYRQFFVQCVVVGTVDFIFGNAAVVLQDCDIRPRMPKPKQKNMITAQGRTDANQNTGIVIQNCTIEANHDLEPNQDEIPTFLGRPWKNFSRAVVMQSSISKVVHPAGWHSWGDDGVVPDTLFYGEYQNTGVGADTSQRVNWKGFKVITDPAEAKKYTPGDFIDGGSWLGSTTFPYRLGL